MGQQEVYNLLKKEKRELSTEEIHKKLKSNRNSIVRSLKQMLKYREVYRRESLRKNIYVKSMFLWGLI